MWTTIIAAVITALMDWLASWKRADEIKTLEWANATQEKQLKTIKDRGLARSVVQKAMNRTAPSTTLAEWSMSRKRNLRLVAIRSGMRTTAAA